LQIIEKVINTGALSIFTNLFSFPIDLLGRVDTESELRTMNRHIYNCHYHHYRARHRNSIMNTITSVITTRTTTTSSWSLLRYRVKSTTIHTYSR
jgi:hypothetical protein